MALSLYELRGVGQGASGDYRHGLGATTTIFGQANLEPGDHGYQYAQTTKSGKTVAGRAQGRAPVDRRVGITRMVTELEYLAGTPGIHPRVLAQRVWQARKALMGTSRWEWASYGAPRAAYDSYDDLAERLQSVERVLGVDQVSPKAMSQLSGLGEYTGPAWGEMTDPVSKLASCIRGAICMPKSFCCDQGTYFQDPYEEPFYDDYYYEEDGPFPSPPPPGGSPSYQQPPPGYQQPPPGYQPDVNEVYTLLDQLEQSFAQIQPQDLPPPPTGLVSISPTQTQVQSPWQIAPAPVQKFATTTLASPTRQISTAISSPAPVPSVSTAPVALSTPTVQPFARQATQYRMPSATSGGAVLATGGGALPAGGGSVMLAGLGARPNPQAAMSRLRAQLASARIQARRRRR